MMILLRLESAHETKLFVLSSLRRCSRDFERPGFLVPSSDRDLASIGTLFETISLEVVGSTLLLDTVRGEPRTWFPSV